MSIMQRASPNTKGSRRASLNPLLEAPTFSHGPQDIQQQQQAKTCQSEVPVHGHAPTRYRPCHCSHALDRLFDDHLSPFKPATEDI
ncbi:hypothetical protein CLAFUW4_08055 [Fulvia fulva]|uniref:Uncharacterized protein n=1 Tax=Passalora fulva TaxID=5499 RepID=A0A9Q8P6K7_PASFU|nr:uncharacterized protein CLAFUR5_08173 [Fulvia fulva]KAK4628767.1 hypothetical protein CLAFUR4_08060 [Fulvia fulva]KAK4629995.1 hypothetical protein CLAFUR0_08055 [Fulvia fulva]UJO15104.1 hypothetical protein CLAFUR5_08173 [Fulvia fulva]WPV12882.1 hypothetical protein CLAFUW4_08055 [Fulvia fulva]WPV27020.1 hypothetical protein CLAFUW7_08055 [Fulvia fulva]